MRIIRHNTIGSGWPLSLIKMELTLTPEQTIAMGVPPEFANKLEFRVLLMECSHFALQDNDLEDSEPLYHVGNMLPCLKCAQERERE